MDWELPPFAVDAKVSADVTRRIARFDARTVRPEVWDEIGPMVRAATAAAAPRNGIEATSLGSRATMLLSWCWEQGKDLRPEVVFHPDTIDEFVSKACSDLTKGTRATYRSTLVRLGEAYVVAPLFAPRSLALPSSEPETPYTAAEVAALRAWARGLSTTKLRDGAATVLAFGLGTGIKAVELNEATVDWIEDTASGLVLHVRSDRPRRVPVRRDWEAAVRAAVTRAHGGLLFRPEREEVNERHVTRFLSRLPVGDAPRLSMQRLRVTWIVQLLDDCVPLNVIADAAGIQADVLGRYVHSMAARSLDHADALLRGCA